MDIFRKKFLDEATENVNSIEEQLLILESSPEDKDILVKIFRSMHTLKGAGAMFGFTHISEFTHIMENIYDKLRNGETPFNKEIMDITLAAVDHIRNLINEAEIPFESIQNTHRNLIERMTQIAGNKVIESVSIPIKQDIKKENTQTSESTYYIVFQPKERIMDNGTNPLYILDEIAGLGKSYAIPHMNKIPDFDTLDVTACYIHWEVFLSTNKDVNDIANVFIFVEDDANIEIHKLSDKNLLDIPDFLDFLNIEKKTGQDIGISNIQKKVSSIKSAKPTVISNNEKTVPELKKNIQEPTLSISNKQKILPKLKDNSISSIRVASEKLDELMNMVSELVITQARLSLYSEKDGNAELTNISENIQKLSRHLRDITFSIVLIPIESLVTRFNRLVRDLSSELKKEVVFVTEGTETELDKTIIENLTDPLLHILRNSIDHGIEDAQIRVSANKPAKGTIMLKAFYSGTNVVIQIIDDGAGINPDRIKEKALSKNLIQPNINYSNKELFDLIFLPGFSTAQNVSDISGRGVGMDVVKKKITDIRGEVEIDSIVGKGTTITLKLPLTLSIIDGLLTLVGDTYFVIPLSIISKLHSEKHDIIKNLRNQLLVFDGKQIPFYYLRKEFNMPESNFKIDQIVIVNYEDQQVGLVVDLVLGEYQAVLKPLGKHYKGQELVSGATILGDGTVALVLDTQKTVKYCTKKYLHSEA